MNNQLKSKEEIQKKIELLLGEVQKIAIIRDYLIGLEVKLSNEVEKKLEEVKRLNEDLKKMNGRG